MTSQVPCSRARIDTARRLHLGFLRWQPLLGLTINSNRLPKVAAGFARVLARNFSALLVFQKAIVTDGHPTGRLPASIHTGCRMINALKSIPVLCGARHAEYAPWDRTTMASFRRNRPRAPKRLCMRGAPLLNRSIEFASGSPELTPAATRLLDRLGHALSSPRLTGDRFTIEGHTDTVGTPDGNRSFS